MKHPDRVEGFNGNLEELARAVGNMKYDALDEFLKYLAEDLHRQADADNERGRIKLANNLYSAALRVYGAREKIAKAWEISEPYMKDSEQ